MKTSYPGDVKASQILENLEVPFPLGGLRAFLVGVLIGPRFIQPSDVLEKLVVEESIDLKNQKAAESFMEVFFGLWNQAAEYRESGKVFEFSLPKKGLKPHDTEGWLEYADDLLCEVRLFLFGLGLSEVPAGDEFAIFGVDESEYLPSLLNMELILLDEELNQGGIDEMDVFKVMEMTSKIRGLMKEHFRSFVSSMKSLEALKRPGFLESPVRSGPKVGRNEPCPCGSGKKFKQCCLQ